MASKCTGRNSELEGVNMGYVFYNANPVNRDTDDCVVRAIAVLLEEDWLSAYIRVCIQGGIDYRMPSTNGTWSAFLSKEGYKRHVIPNTCPDCYTVRDFCYDHPEGKFLVATGDHVVAVVNGNYYDTWDCGDKVPMYYWEKENY